MLCVLYTLIRVYSSTPDNIANVKRRYRAPYSITRPNHLRNVLSTRVYTTTTKTIGERIGLLLGKTTFFVLTKIINLIANLNT